MKKIVLIGAGYAGVLTAKRLAKKLKREDVEITVFNKNSYHTMLTELHEVAAGRVEEESIRLDLDAIFAHRKINLIVDEVEKVDFNNKQIYTADGYVKDYDYLVIGTGCKPTFFDLKGSENAFPLWSYEDAVKLNVQINDMFRRACAEKDEVERKKLLSFVIVGSGFTGVEMAGELGEYKDELCYKYDINSNEVSIQIIEMGDKILPFYPDKLTSKIIDRLNKLGVEILTNQAVCSIESKSCKLTTENMLDTHTVIWAAGIEGSELVKKLENISKVNRGRIQTNEFLESVDQKDVYIVGDNIFYVPEGETHPVPQMVENAEHSSKTVTQNIFASIKGTKRVEYKPVFQGSMVCVGSRWGAAYVGKKEKKRSFTGFSAMFIKHFVNCMYFMEVLGLSKVWSYLVHEVFTVKNKRSFVGGHFSNHRSAPGFFLLPLRLFVGFMWLVSGLVKLPKIVKDWRNVFLMPTNPIDGSSAATGESLSLNVSNAVSEAVSETLGNDVSKEAASEIVEKISANASEVVNSVTTSGDETGIVKFLGEVGSFTETSAENALPVPGFIESIMNQFYKWFFWSSEGGFTLFASITQASMIIMEIIIGGMFLLGMLTPIAAIIGAMLSVVIYLSGWSYITIVFFGVSSIACIFAGNVVGVDYYLFPYIDRKLRKWKITRKWYLYFNHE